jgi:hypothetical protein
VRGIAPQHPATVFSPSRPEYVSGSNNVVREMLSLKKA